MMTARKWLALILWMAAGLGTEPARAAADPQLARALAELDDYVQSSMAKT